MSDTPPLAHSIVLSPHTICDYCINTPSTLCPSQGMSEEDIANELAPAPEDPAPLSQEEEEERAALLREGFSSWNRRDFQVGGR